jgi:flagellin
MGINVKTNMASMTANRQLGQTTRALGRSFERLSSGLRIARAADDAAGLGVAENLRAAHTSARVAARNINDGISAVGVAEAATNEVANILIRMRELAVQGASGVLGEVERSYIETEADQLLAEIDRIASSTQFNGVSLTSSAAGGQAIEIQVGIGDNTVSGVDVIAVTFADLTLANTFTALNTAVTTNLDSTDPLSYQALITELDTALESVNTARSLYGASENRLGSALNSIEAFAETSQAAESRIRDADFGYETAQMSANQILQQAGTAVLAQAKNINQAALSLLQ